MFFVLGWIVLLTLSTLFFVDIFLLFRTENGLKVRRLLTDKFSNSDENPVVITLENKYPFSVEVAVIDELPTQFQKRDFEYKANLKLQEKTDFEYKLRPVERGEYYFQIRVRTQKSYLGTDQNPLPIIPGMVATVDILTGEKTVMSYLLKPLKRAQANALSER